MPPRTLTLAVALSLYGAFATPTDAATTPQGDVSQIHTIVVIYAENRGFDHLYGHFPGANGLDNATPEQMTQLDRDGSVLPTLPRIAGSGLTDPSDPTQIPPEQTEGNPNAPFALDDPNGYAVDF
ncbi:MAG TPA: alkaline phosphatase family protein, partial [Dokdonella sp.]|nr:alkaline phosphatase family protein [Dokdonella sp.]